MAIPSLQEAEKLVGGCTILPLAKEIFSDITTPIALLRQMQQHSRQFFILESITGQENWGRYSFVGFQPTLVIKGKDDQMTITSQHEEQAIQYNGPINAIRQVLKQYKSPKVKGLPPFTGGLVGYFSYDFIRRTMPGVEVPQAAYLKTDDFQLMLIDKLIAFDHYKQKIYLIANIKTDNLPHNYAEGVQKLQQLEKMLLEQVVPKTSSPCIMGDVAPLFPPEIFRQMADETRQLVRDGELLEASLVNGFSADFKGSLLPAYRVMRTAAPSPYMVYLHMDGMEVACASPETLIKLRGGKVSCFPLAGCSPRAVDEESNAEAGEQLLNDENKLAEHDLYVDLCRDDMGRLSDFGTVEVKEYRKVKSYAHVNCLGSRVTGRMREGLDALDALTAVLPSGTLSGFPRQRACERLSVLEGVARGLYGGALGYIDFAGDMDMCIGVQLAVHTGGKVYVQGDATVTADSEPGMAYQEAQDKAGTVLDILRYAERMKPNGGID